jgi:hypothetical protein
VLRVTSVMRWILAVAARRPSITGSERLAFSSAASALWSPQGQLLLWIK